MSWSLSQRVRDVVSALEDIEDEVEKLEDEGTGHTEEEVAAAYDEGQRDLVRALFSQLERREAGAGLPFPVYSDVMTFEEVRKMIKKEM